VPSAWADVQQMMPVPSPWDTPKVVETQSCRGTAAEAQLHAEEIARAETPLSPEVTDAGLDYPIWPSDLMRDAAEGTMAALEVANATVLPGAETGYAMGRGRRISGGSTEPTSPRSPRVPRLDITRQPQSARLGSSGVLGVDVGLGAAATGDEKVYDPHVHFATACGEDDENLRHLVGEVNLFFLCELSSLHSAIHEDELAAQLLWHARPYSDALPTNHPDTAVVWGGIGRVAFHSGSFDIAARCMARARRIREKTIGEDTVETATTYNNLACSLASLDRPLEAGALLELGAELLKVLLGHDHPRTQTVLRNLEKSRSMHKHLRCEIPHLFGIPVLDKYKVVKKGKKKKGKKGAGTSEDESAKSSKAPETTKAPKAAKARRSSAK